jgi:hypothetical protein
VADVPSRTGGECTARGVSRFSFRHPRRIAKRELPIGRRRVTLLGDVYELVSKQCAASCRQRDVTSVVEDHVPADRVCKRVDGSRGLGSASVGVYPHV